MMRLIDADELKAYMSKEGFGTPGVLRCSRCGAEDENGSCYNYCPHCGARMDVAPVPAAQGKWEYTNSSGDPFCAVLKCSCCGSEDENGCCYNYCPYCGAKMGGAEDE